MGDADDKILYLITLRFRLRDAADILYIVILLP